MSRKRLPNITLIVLAVILSSSRPTFPAQGTRTFLLENVGVAFNLPQQYSILEREMFEDGYAIRVFFGKDFRPNHLDSLDVALVFWPGAYDGRQHVHGYTPRQYVDIEYRTVMERHRRQLSGYEAEPESIKLFGNKAVRYVLQEFLCCIIAVGYLSQNQLSGRAAKSGGEYLVRIITGGMDDDSIAVFNALVKSLRLSK